MKRNREIKNDALNALDGHWGWAILVCIIAGAIAGVIALPQSVANGARGALGFSNPAALAFAGLSLALASFTCLCSIFGTNPLNVGLVNSLSRFFKEGDYHTVGNMFRLGFGEGRYWKNVAGMFLMGLFTFLWTLLFIIPGIIKAYAYAMTPYILVDNPEYGPNEARLKSIEMMRGHKWKLFGMELSFIGWFLLCILSLGVGFIWLSPYYRMAHVSFYNNLKEEQAPKAAPAEITAE